MAAGIVPGAGTTLGRGNADGPPETFTQIGQCVSIDGPDMDMSKIDTFHLLSATKTSRPSLIPDMGQLKLKVYYDPTDATSHQILLADFLAGTIRNYQLMFNVIGTEAIWEFSAYILNFPVGGLEVESNAEANLTLKINSVPARTERT